MKVAILGAGSGAFAAAVDMKLRGFDVSLCSTYTPDVTGRLRHISKRGGVEYSGTFGDGLLELKAHDSLSPVRNADVVMVVTLAAGYAHYAARVGRLLWKGQLVFLNPGYLGGSLTFAKTVREKAGLSLRVCETNNLPYVCRFTGLTHVSIFRKSKLIFLSSFPSADNRNDLDTLKEIYPEATERSNVLETGMMNPNIVVHPPGMLLNAGWIEATEGDFLFYNVGCTESVSRVIEALDAERMSICKRLGARTMSIGEYYRRNGYTDSATARVRDVLRNSGPNRNIRSPSTLDNRYITEDVPYGLVPMSCFGEVGAVDTPVINSLVGLASAAMGVNYARTGLTAEKMGIRGMNVPRLRRYLETGL